jgi:hypothetical protein
VPKRSRKLPIVTGPDHVEFTIAEKEWQRIESAYGKKLPPNVRSDVLAKTQSFVLAAILEQRAERAANAEEIIKACKRTARNFQLALLKSTSSSDAAICSRELIKENFQDARWGSSREQLFGAIKNLLNTFLSACDLSLKELSEPSHFEEGKAWGWWVFQLRGILNDRGLPVGVSKGSDRRRRLSQFVVLVKELQLCLPAECTRHRHSDGAMTEAIALAVAGYKQLTSPRQ